MRIVLFSLIFLSLKSLSAVQDSIFIVVSDVSSPKILSQVNTSLSALPGVNVVSYCPGKNTLFVIVDRSLQPTDAQISNSLNLCMGGRLVHYIKDISLEEYTFFRDDCSGGIKPVNGVEDPDLNKTD